MATTVDAPRHCYRLVVGEDEHEPGQVIELGAPDPHAALAFVQRTLPGREIELFEDGRRLGLVKCTREGFWVLLPRHALSPGSAAPTA